MVTKDKFIERMLVIIRRDLEKLLPEEDMLDEMNEIFETYLETNFLQIKRGK